MKTPRPHQKEAINAVVKGFKTSDRGKLIMACGTGKTLVANWVREALGAQRTIIFVPSIALVSQTIREWKAGCSDDFEALAVCCDGTVANSSAAAEDDTESLATVDAVVTTDYRVISNFMQKGGRLVIFSTYHSAETIAAAISLAATPKCDLLIADEAHRTAGAMGSLFTAVLDDKRLPAKLKLFMTATPRLYHENSEVAIASMDDESLYGTEFYRLDLAKAVSLKLLADYEILVVFATTKEATELLDKNERLKVRDRSLQARDLAVRIALLRAISERTLRRVITFHSSTARAASNADFIPHLHEWLPQKHKSIAGLWAKTVNYRMSMDERKKTINEFLSCKSPSILTNAKCLGEGVDVPAIDGVAFMDAKSSKVEIIQAVGRALRKSAGKSVATIIIPVIYADNGSDDQFVDRKFDYVLDILSAIRAHDSDVLNKLERWKVSTRATHNKGLSGNRKHTGASILFSDSDMCNNEIANWFVARVIGHANHGWRDKWLKSYTDVKKTVDAGKPLSWGQKYWLREQRHRFHERTVRRQELLRPLMDYAPPPQKLKLRDQLNEILATTEKNGYISSVTNASRIGAILHNVARCKSSDVTYMKEIQSTLKVIRGFPTPRDYKSKRTAAAYADAIDAEMKRTGRRPQWKLGTKGRTMLQWIGHARHNPKILYGVRPISWLTAYFDTPKIVHSKYNLNRAATACSKYTKLVKVFYKKHGRLPRLGGAGTTKAESLLADRVSHYMNDSPAENTNELRSYVESLPAEAKNYRLFQWMTKVSAFVKEHKKYITAKSAGRVGLMSQREYWVKHKDVKLRKRVAAFEKQMIAACAK